MDLLEILLTSLSCKDGKQELVYLSSKFVVDESGICKTIGHTSTRLIIGGWQMNTEQQAKLANPYRSTVQGPSSDP